jgi:MFS family permease
MPATPPPGTGPPTRVVRTAAAADAAAAPGSGAPTRRLGLALAVIATAQLMVVLDGTIVNVALPHIQNAPGFSDRNLAWVVNADALVFGGLLLPGGRSGDLLGRRRIFITGLLVFSLASLLGGFATDQAWLLSARAIQGAGAAMAAPTALALIIALAAIRVTRQDLSGVDQTTAPAG